MDRFIAHSLLIGGICVALIYASLSILDMSADYCIEFAVFSLIAVIGWQEIRSVDQVGESE